MFIVQPPSEFAFERKSRLTGLGRTATAHSVLLAHSDEE
jgi:hypothetical protein